MNYHLPRRTGPADGELPAAVRLRAPRMIAGQIEFMLLSQAEVTYVLETRPTLPATSWQMLQQVDGTGALLKLSAPRDSQTRCYRVRPERRAP